MNLNFKKEFLEAVIKEEKKQTIRKWDKCFLKEGQKIFINYKYPAIVEKIIRKRFSEIDEEDAKLNGYSSKEELKKSVKEVYQDIDENSFIFIIRFHLIK